MAAEWWTTELENCLRRAIEKCGPNYRMGEAAGIEENGQKFVKFYYDRDDGERKFRTMEFSVLKANCLSGDDGLKALVWYLKDHVRV